MTRKILKGSVMVGLFVLAGTVLSAKAAEPAWPSARPVKFIVGFAPGGGLDVLTRTMAPKFTEATGQTWVAENRPGAGGNLATEAVATGTPDGYTVLIALDTQLTVNQSLYNRPFSIEKDLQPVSMLAAGEIILVVNAKFPAKTLKEFIAMAKEKPGSLSYSSSGIGASGHLIGELLKKRADINILHVPYKGGADAIAAVLAGDVTMHPAAVATSLQMVNQGRLRAIASTGAARSRSFPNVPTVAEAGYPGYLAPLWFALAVPAKTPRAIVDRIRAEAIKIVNAPDVQAALARQGLRPETSTPEELGARIAAESRQWAGIIKDANIRLQ